MSGDASDKPAKPGRACALCRKHKTRCIGGLPCRRCIESNVICTPQPPPSKSLADRVTSLEAKQDKFVRKLRAAQREIRDLRGDDGSSSEDTSSSGEEGSVDTKDRKQRRRSNQALQASGSRNPASRSERPSLNEQWATPDLPSIANPSRRTSDGNAVDERLDMEEDLTVIDAIRLGKRMYDGEHNGERSHKRARSNGFSLESEEGRVMEQVSLDIFYSRCASKLPFVDPASETDLQGLRRSNALYYWAIIATGSREAEELSPIHQYAQNLAIRKARETLFGRQATMDDLKGLLVINTYLSQLRSPGHLVGIMHELELGIRCSALVQGFEYSRRGPTASMATYAEEMELASCLRTFGWLVVMDRMTAVLNGRPNLIQTERKHMITNVISMIGTIQYLDCKRVSDIELCAFAEVSDLLAQLRETFSAYHGPSKPDEVAIIPAYNDTLDAWYRKWTNAEVNPILNTFIRTGEDRLAMDKCVHSIRYVYSSSKLHINTFPLRGVKHASELTEEQSTCLRAAVVSARGVCLHAVKHNQPNNILYSTNITQLQLTFAAIFLLRMLRLLPGDFDEATILDEIRALANLLSQISGKYYAKRISSMLHLLEDQRSDNAQQSSMDRGDHHSDSVVNATTLPEHKEASPLARDSVQTDQYLTEWKPETTHEWDADLGTASFWAWMQDDNVAPSQI